MENDNHAELRSKGLRDIPISMLEEQFQDVLARNSAACDAEYGTRADDGALVFHFFPPGYGINIDKDWSSWTKFRDRLEQAIMANFDTSTITANYAEELKSFYLIVLPRPAVPDLTALIERFFSQLEA